MWPKKNAKLAMKIAATGKTHSNKASDSSPSEIIKKNWLFGPAFKACDAIPSLDFALSSKKYKKVMTIIDGLIIKISFLILVKTVFILSRIINKKMIGKIKIIWYCVNAKIEKIIPYKSALVNFNWSNLTNKLKNNKKQIKHENITIA